MEKQVALGSFVPDFLQTLFLCAIFALVQLFLWQKDFTYAILVL